MKCENCRESFNLAKTLREARKAWPCKRGSEQWKDRQTWLDDSGLCAKCMIWEWSVDPDDE